MLPNLKGGRRYTQNVLQKDAIHPPPHRSIGHVVLTRFNMRQYNFTAKPESLTDYRQWFEQRTEIFRTICLPSLIRQDQRPDLWLIGLDARHRELAHELLSAISPYPWIEPAWQQVHHADDDIVSPFAPGITKVSKRHEVIATTRVDNDDALATRYIADAHTYAKSVVETEPRLSDFWLAFTSGALLHEERFYHYMHSRPHFLTRVTTGLSAIDHVMAINHTWLYKEGRKVFTPTTSTPMWLQHVHESNVSNRAQPSLLEFADPVRIQSLFGFELRKLPRTSL